MMSFVNITYKYPCVCCKKPVKKNQKGLCCTICQGWLHISCVGISPQIYDDLSISFENWRCPKCLFQELPFPLAEQIQSESITSSSSPKLDSLQSDTNQSNLKYEKLKCRGLKICQLNVNSLIRHLDEVKSLLIFNKIDIFAVNETKIDSSVSDHEIAIENYVTIRKDRNRQGGGVALYIHKSLKVEILQHDSFKDLEIVAVVVHSKNCKPLSVATWYRPPSSKSDVLEAYEIFLQYVDSLKKDCILIGDINCDLLLHVPSSNTRMYSEINDLFAFKQINTTEPTRLTSQSATLVDHMLSNCSHRIKSHGVIHSGLSDHSISFLVLKSESSSFPRTVQFRNCKNFDIDKFISDLRNQPWETVKDFVNIDDAVEKWQNMFTYIIDKHMPIRTKRSKQRNTPWMNSNIFKLMKDRDKIKHKAFRTKNDDMMSLYRKLRNKVTFEIRKAKRKYFTDKFSNVNSDPRQTWKILKSVISGNKCDSSIGDMNESCKVADEFNSYFASIGTTLADQIPTVHFSYENNVPLDSTFSFTPISETETLDLIRKLKNKKSIGLDGISVFVLKLSAKVIAPTLTYLINKSMKTGKFPNSWKAAKIVPIHKNGDKSFPGNFRPISLLPCVSKILERVVQRQLLDYLHKNNILCVEQSGFRPRHSTTSTLIKVTDDWLQAMDDSKYTGAVFVDLRKAFDTVDHQILMKKMHSIGIKHLSSDWFYSYLSRRTCKTLVNNSLSSPKFVSCGVPQGSLLGPLLFIIYVNDLAKYIKSSSLKLYADDTVLYYSDTSVRKIESVLNSDLLLLDQWMNKNRLSVNYDKTVCMLIGSRYMLSKEKNLNVILCKTQIQQVNNVKYLGVICDEQIKWNIHIDKMVKKIGQMVSFLGRLRSTLNESILKLLYNAVVLPHFDYGDIVYGSACKYLTERLQKLQNRAGRLILHINRDSRIPNLEIHNALAWDTLSDRRNQHLLIYMFKSLNNMTPIYISDSFTISAHEYHLRFSGKLYTPKPHTEFLKRTFKYRGAMAYNNLPVFVRAASTLNAFKSELTLFHSDNSMVKTF